MKYHATRLFHNEVDQLDSDMWAMQIEHQHPRLRHRLHRIANAFAAEPLIFHASERIGVDSEDAGFADDHGAGLDLAKGIEGVLQTRSEYTCL